MAFELPTPEDDGLFVAEVGSWARDKHHFLERYIVAFTRAMRNKGWSGLHYIDLFAGPGILRVKDGPLVWGSPLIAAQAPHPFTQLHLVEKGRREFKALSERVARFDLPCEPQLICGDANEAVGEIVQTIPDGSLNLAFLDPYGLHLQFSTLETLAARRADLIIFFPDHLDALRNFGNYLDSKSNLSRVLGTDRWITECKNAPKDRWADILQQVYTEQIRQIGYAEFADERISRPDGRFLYKLIFCSRHSAGAKIWRGISMKKRGGQGELPFG